MSPSHASMNNTEFAWAKEKERLNDGNNNGQATHGARKHASRLGQFVWQVDQHGGSGQECRIVMDNSSRLTFIHANKLCVVHASVWRRHLEHFPVDFITLKQIMHNIVKHPVRNTPLESSRMRGLIRKLTADSEAIPMKRKCRSLLLTCEIFF